MALALALGAVLCSRAVAQPAAQAQGPEPSGPVAAAPGSAAPSHEAKALGAAREPVISRPGAGEAKAKHGAGVGQTSLALGGVLALAVASAAVVRALARSRGGFLASLGAGGRAPAGIMEILGRYPVGRGCTLVLLKIDRRVLLLSQSAGGRLGAGAGMTTLCEMTDPEEVASILLRARDADGDSMSERFRSLLTRFDRGMPDEGPAEAVGRRLRAAAGGDRAELWDDRTNIPVVDLTKQPGAPEVGAAGQLRRRLASFRGGDGGRV